MKKIKKAILADETKSTDRHQVTIPKKIWEYLNLKEGVRFIVRVYDDRRIELIERESSMDLTDEQWAKLVSLAKSKKNKGKVFSKSKDAKKYLKKL